MGNELKCPECKGKVWKSITVGQRALGEDITKKYVRYNCDKCKLFWEEGDFV